MRVIFLMVMSLFVMAGQARAAGFVCPEPESGITVAGPKVRTAPFGRTEVVCRYYARQYHKATIEVYYYGDYRRPRECRSHVYSDADLRSWQYQIYAFVTDDDPGDILTQKYWSGLARQLMQQTESDALPCTAPRGLPLPAEDSRNVRKPIKNKQMQTISNVSPEPALSAEEGQTRRQRAELQRIQAGPPAAADGW
ncbi:MAG: hypothetical protein KC897_03600 [Candidatus Omnitrophica bacterium]|nr:hypothetical protein [Candidatus Omnitrophota bacterium]MCB9720557.1 hypothetical protein [Candidatus Omnitrophota bacterium]